MRAGVADAVLPVAVRQIAARVARVEGEFQHLHAGQTRVGKQLRDLRRGIAEILGDELDVVEPAGQHADERHAGALDPATVFRGRLAIGHGPVALEAAEVVDADDVVELRRSANASDPPLKAVLLHGLVVVEWVAPELTVGAEVVRRHAGDLNGHVSLVELEFLRLAPHVGGVHRHIDGDVADDADAETVDVALERTPLPEEEKLNVGEQLHVPAQLRAVALERVGPVQPRAFVGPFGPGLHAEMPLERHEERVVRQPEGVFLHELAVGGVGLCQQTVCRAAQHLVTFFVQSTVVDGIGGGFPIDVLIFLGQKQTALGKLVEIDKIRVARKRREGLIGAVAVAGGADG